MNIYAASIGQLLIVTVFVFLIWFKVLYWTVKNQPPNPQYAKLITTSAGLLISSLAVVLIMIIRATEYTYAVALNEYIIFCFALLAVGNVLFIVSASIKTGWFQFKLFLVISVIWNIVFVASNLKGI